MRKSQRTRIHNFQSSTLPPAGPNIDWCINITISYCSIQSKAMTEDRIIRSKAYAADQGPHGDGSSPA